MGKDCRATIETISAQLKITVDIVNNVSLETEDEESLFRALSEDQRNVVMKRNPVFLESLVPLKNRY